MMRVMITLQHAWLVHLVGVGKIHISGPGCSTATTRRLNVLEYWQTLEKWTGTRQTPGSWGRTPLYWALEGGHSDKLDIILQQPNIDYNVKTNHPTVVTLAQAAVSGGNVKSVETFRLSVKPPLG